MNNGRLVCVNCESTDIEEFTDGVFECLECGSYFEDEDYELEQLQQHRKRQKEKELLNS